MGFLPTTTDPCLYIKKETGTIIVVYVDDGLIVGPSQEESKDIIDTLNKRFRVKELSGNYFLGMELKQEVDKIRLTQRRYIADLLIKFNMADTKGATTPMVNMSSLMVKEEGADTRAPYREAIGSLQYLATRTRPDILFAVNLLSRFNQSPKDKHWTGVKRVLSYLSTTIDYGLEFCQDEVIRAFSDADWAGDQTTRQSTSGILLMFSGPIVFSSRRQASIAQSSAEAEYLAASEAAKEVVWLTQLLGELGIKCDQPTLHIDNIPAIRQIKSNENRRRSKHIELKYHFIRKLYNDKVFRLAHVTSSEQSADFLTKPLNAPHLQNLLESIGIRHGLTPRNSVANSDDGGRNH